MNGRVYDYNLGRFMSVDPFIQAPTSTQSINPYSYIMNNPLAGTDPTGYCSTASRIDGGGGSSPCTVIDFSGGQSDVTARVTTTELPSPTANGAEVSQSPQSKSTNFEGRVDNNEASGDSAGNGNEGGSHGEKKRYGINQRKIREMIKEPELYGKQIAEVASLLSDEDARGLLGDQYRMFQSELASAFNDGWDAKILSDSIIAPGFTFVGFNPAARALGQAIERSVTYQKVVQIRNNAISHSVRKVAQPAVQFYRLPRKNKVAVCELFLSLCGRGSVVDSLMHRAPYVAPRPPYTFPRPTPSQYEPAGGIILHPRRFVDDHLDGSGVTR